MWVRCNPGTHTPTLAVRRDDVLINNYRHGGVNVLYNGSLVLPYVRSSDAGEYRCYDMSSSPRRGPFRVDLYINGKLFVTVNITTISTNVVQTITKWWFGLHCKGYDFSSLNLLWMKQHTTLSILSCDFLPRKLILCMMCKIKTCINQTSNLR